MRKMAFCAVCNDSFVPGCVSLIYSFIKHNKWFDGDIVVIYNDRFLPLSTESMNVLRGVYDNIIFKCVDSAPYEEFMNKFYDVALLKHYVNCFFKYDIFRMSEYDIVVYMDSDILVIDDVRLLFNYPEKYIFGAVPNGMSGKIISDDYCNWYDGVSMNMGVFSVTKPNNLLYDDIMNFTKVFEIGKYNDFSGRFVEQDILNMYFQNKDVVIFNHNYNKCKYDYKNGDDSKLIHYWSYKPWNGYVNEGPNINWKDAYDKYADYFNEMKIKLEYGN